MFHFGRNALVSGFVSVVFRTVKGRDVRSDVMLSELQHV